MFGIGWIELLLVIAMPVLVLTILYFVVRLAVRAENRRDKKSN